MEEALKKEFEKRLAKARLEASRRGFSCLLVFALAPRRVGDLLYLANHQPMLPGHPRRFGFRGRGYSALVLPVEGEPSLLVSTPFSDKDVYIKNVKYEDNLMEEIGRDVKARGLQKADIGIVGLDILAAALYDDLKAELYQAKFYPADDIVMNLRASKSPYELAILRRGAEIADEVGELLRSYLRPGLREIDVYQFITGELTKRGVDGAFATCQSGRRSETPYELNPATDKIIEDGDMVHMEINGKLQGYMIDVCRSTVVGTLKEEQEHILNVTLEMLERSVAAMKPGITAESLERISGGIALDYGFDKNHSHAYNGPATYLGHAIGLGVDEPPVLAKGDKTILVPGMVITVEPGLYNTGYGGCRIEDEVLVTETGFEILNKYDRKWW